MSIGSEPEAILVVGGGAKAAALAAFAAAAQLNGLTVPQINIVERSAIAANWTGQWGFTDGETTLGSPPEKDVGFPYLPLSRDIYSADRSAVVRVLATLRARFSWQAFLTRDPMSEPFMASPSQSPVPNYAAMRTLPQYNEWIDAGRPAPTHWMWGAYIGWVIASAVEAVPRGQRRISLFHGHLSVIERDSQAGCLRATISDGRSGTGDAGRRIGGLSGVVVTGPGEAFSSRQHTDADSIVAASSRISNGVDYWLGDFFGAALAPSLATGRSLHLSIVGTGETAGSILVDLIRRYRDFQHSTRDCGQMLVSTINRRGMVYTRGQNFAENRWYSGQEGWIDRSLAIRKEFIGRTDRGVFSPEVMREIDRFKDLAIRPMRVGSVTICRDSILIRSASDAAGSEEVPDLNEAPDISCDALIDATGFDTLAFRGLLSQDLVEEFGLMGLPSPGEPIDWTDREAISAAGALLGKRLDSSLSIVIGGPPPRFARVHLPSLSGLSYGPGYANLSCLGLLAQRILSAYCAWIR